MIRAVLGQLRANRERIQRLSKEGGWIVSGQIATVLGALVLVRVLTEYLQPAQYGELALGLTLAGLINQVIMGGITAGIGRFYSIAAEKGDFSGYLSSSKSLLVIATIVVSLITVTVVASLLIFDKVQWVGLVAATMVFSLINGYNSALRGLQNAARQRSVVALHSGLDAWLKIGFVIVIMLLFGSSATAVVFGYALSAFIITASQLFFLKRLLLKQAITKLGSRNRSWRLRIWSYSWPFSAWGIFTWAQQASDRWVLEFYASTTDVGMYAVLFQLGYAPISVVAVLSMSFLMPILYQRSGDATDPKKNTALRNLGWKIMFASLSISVFGFIISLVLHEHIFNIFVSVSYRSISYLLPWMVLASGLFACGQVVSYMLQVELKTLNSLLPKIGTAIFGVVAAFLGAAFFGTAGVVAAQVAFSCSYLIWLSCVYLKNEDKSTCT